MKNQIDKIIEHRDVVPIVSRRFGIEDMFAAYKQGCKDSIYAGFKTAHAQRIKKWYSMFIEDYTDQNGS